MRVGTHVSIAGGLENAPGNAAKVKAEVFQIFSRSPHGGPVKPITKDKILAFRGEMDKNKFDTFYIHTPYFINFASVNNKIYFGSISVVREELERGSLLGCQAVMTHLGSFGELNESEGLNRVAEAISKIMEGYQGSTQLLLEMSAGSGRIVGDSLEEIDAILRHKKVARFDVGVCVDTCHAFASGFDITSPTGVAKVFNDFENVIGLERLKLIHANDSKGQFGQHLDRHENIGKGNIGLPGFKAMANHKYLRKLDWILETPKDNPKDDPKNIALLKKIRK